MVLMWSFSLASPKASMPSGVRTFSNNTLVARLTPASVAWADSTTAISRV